MKFKITTEELIEIASKSKDVKEILNKLFPQCFDENEKTDDAGKDSVSIKNGDMYHIVHGTPEGFTITKAKYPRCSSGAVKIFRGDAGGKINAELYVINNTKRFTLKDVYFALEYCGLEKHTDTITCRLNDCNHPNTVIKHREDKLVF